MTQSSVEFCRSNFTSDNLSVSVTGVATTTERELPVRLQDDIAAFQKSSRAENTKRSYLTAWQQFEGWCELHGRMALPTSPSTLQAFLVDLAREYKLATIESRLAAIANAHRLAGHPFDRKVMVGLTLDGIKRALGTAARKAKAIPLATLQNAVVGLPATVHGARDRALLLIGFFGALRRSEIVGLDVDRRMAEGATGWIEVTSEGLIIHLARSKTDQHGAGQQIGIPRRIDKLCPVQALLNWLVVSDISEGAIFRRVLKGGFVCNRLTSQSVRLIVRKHIGEGKTAHSLRAGCQSAAKVDPPNRRGTLTPYGGALPAAAPGAA